VVIVDEASMMDSHMFARLLQSLPEDCRLLLLGDKDQLPSVGPGQVLADLSAPFQQEKGIFSSALAQEFCELGKQYYEQRKAQLVQAEEPSLTASLEYAGWSELQADNEVSLHSSLSMQEVLQNKVVFLTQSQRVGSAIWQWWEQVQQSGRAPVDNDYSASGASGASALASGKVVGKAVRTLCWGRGDFSELSQTHPYLLEEFAAPYRELSEFLRREKPTADARHRIDHESLYQKMNELLIRQKVLTSHRHGPFGALLFNQQAVEYISQKKTPRSGLPLLDGMPVMITRNQRLSGYEISNGDLGFLMSKRQGGREDWFCLLPADGLVLALPLGQLHGWEYAFAITVHKSQGSEFRKVAFFSTTSPDSPLWTRQMVYTAITRAKESLLFIHSGAEELPIPQEGEERVSLLG
jgi:exodeoxyribonuclease V alpha subunit